MDSHPEMSRVTLSVLLLSIPGCGYGQDPPQQQQQWNLHDFSNTRYVEFAIKVTENGETRDGTSSLAFEETGDGQVRVQFEGTLGETSAAFTTTAPEDDVYGQVMMQVMMTPAAAPMALTVFAPFMPMYFGGRDLSSDASWTFNDGEQEFSFQVESDCSYAGLDGRKIVWRVDGEVASDACVNTTIPVPLAFTFRPDDDEFYELELTEYVSR